MKNKNRLFLATLFLIFPFIVSCAQNVSPNTYEVADVGVVNKVLPGTVISKRNVNIDAKSGMGGLAGVAAGGVAGSTVGGNSAVNIVGATAGAVLGGVLGNKIDKSINRHQGIEYIVKLKNGSFISVAQAVEMKFAVGDHVLVVYGKMTRLIADNTIKKSVHRG